MNRKVGIFLIAVGTLIIAGLIYYMFFYSPASGPLGPIENTGVGVLEPGGGTGQTKEGQGSAAKKTISPAPRIDETEIRQAGAEKFASSFAERFGSFSNQSGFENFKDLEPSMTQNFKEYVANVKNDLEKKYGDYASYYAISSKALNSKAEGFQEGSSGTAVSVTLLREETKTSGETRRFYQDLKLGLVLSGKVWKVERAEWGDEKSIK